jgi:hypothetical protein
MIDKFNARSVFVLALFTITLGGGLCAGDTVDR